MDLRRFHGRLSLNGSVVGVSRTASVTFDKTVWFDSVLFNTIAFFVVLSVVVSLDFVTLEDVDVLVKRELFVNMADSTLTLVVCLECVASGGVVSEAFLV